MRREITIVVEKISNGYLFTETKDSTNISKTFKDTKDDLFSFLKKNETIGGVIDNDDDMVILDIIRQDIKIGDVPIDTKNLLENVVEKEKFNPFKTKEINLDELRLSINKQNCYSQEKLKEIDFFELDRQLPMSNAKKAEICGVKTGTFFSTYNNLKKGTMNFATVDVRIYMTVLAKYYEMSLGIRHLKKEEIERITNDVKVQIHNLQEIVNKNCLIDSKSLKPILEALKHTVHVK